MRSRLRKGKLLLASFICLASIGCKSERTTDGEGRDRDIFIAQEAARTKTDRAYWVSSRPDVRFNWGFSRVSYDPPSDEHGRAFRWIGAKSVVKLRGSQKPMKLEMHGWVDNKALRTKPIISLYIDKRLVMATQPIDGLYDIDAQIPAEWLKDAEFVNLEIVLSAVGFHWVDPPDLKVALLTHLGWQPLP